MCPATISPSRERPLQALEGLQLEPTLASELFRRQGPLSTSLGFAKSGGSRLARAGERDRFYGQRTSARHTGQLYKLLYSSRERPPVSLSLSRSSLSGEVGDKPQPWLTCLTAIGPCRLQVFLTKHPLQVTAENEPCRRASIRSAKTSVSASSTSSRPAA